MHFARFSISVVLTIGRCVTDAVIARRRAWSYESPNILLVRDANPPVLKNVKHLVGNSFFSTQTKSKAKEMLYGAIMSRYD